MPEYSSIAKPSKLKQSTIKKSKIENKMHKSYDPKGAISDFTVAVKN